MQINKTYISALILCVLLSACAGNKQKPVAPPSAAKITVIEKVEPRKESLLEYASYQLSASAESQKKELQELNQTLVINKQDIPTRLKLALLYGLPNSKVRDVNKAQALLDDLIREPSIETEQKTLANLLRDYIVDIAKLNQKIRDEQKRSDTLQAKADNAQQRADGLQRKLDELKNIEKTMTDRGQGNN